MSEPDTFARAHVLPADVQYAGRVDWWQIITDLERAGVPHSVVAVEVGRSKGWVANLKNMPDTEPRFHDGMLLLGLWRDRIGGEVPAA